MSDSATRPWYQEPFVWMVISFPLSAVLAGAVTVYLAIVSYDGLVVDDYYKRGLEINKRLEREQLAADNEISLEVKLVGERLLVNIPHSPQFDIPDKLTATVSHATKPGLDQAISLRRQSNTLYTAAQVRLPIGRWYVEVSTPQWRVTTYLVTSSHHD